MADNRFLADGTDARFPSPGTDARFPGDGLDYEFLDGLDTRHEGSAYAGEDDDWTLTVTASDEDSFDIETDAAGTLYWLCDDTASRDGATVKAGGGLASGSFAVVNGSQSEDIDLSAVAAGDHYVHFVLDAGTDDFSNVETVPITLAAALPLGLTQIAAYTSTLSSTTAALVIPSGVQAGSLLIAILRPSTFANTAPASITPPTGWSLVTSHASGDGTYVYKKPVADGTEGGTTVNWTLASAMKSVFVFAEIAGAVGTIEATFADVLNPPSHSPAGGSADTIWIALVSCKRNDNAVTGAPTGYSGLVTAESSGANSSNGGEITIGAAHKQATAASDDPGAFTTTGTVTNQPKSGTISVR
jgi:hypothetical protein